MFLSDLFFILLDFFIYFLSIYRLPYSTNSYNIDAATKDKIVYPSLDPSVFEIKFPNQDIKGRVK